MTNYKLKSKKIKIVILALIFVFIPKVYSEPLYYSWGVDTVEAENWKNDVIDGREVIKTDQIEKFAEVRIAVPETGDYQLYIHLYHQWQNHCPYLFFEAVDSYDQNYKSYIFSEHRWYLKPGQGRWEFRTPSATPFWHLNKGELKLKFWLEAKDNCWQQNDVEVESFVAIDKFILIPVNVKENKFSYHPKDLE